MNLAFPSDAHSADSSLRWLGRPRVLCAVLIAAGTLLLGGCAVAMLKGAASTGSSTPAQRTDSRTPAQRSADASISTAVRSKLAANAALRSFNLSVDTHDGIVTLRGQVANVEQRNAAQLAALSVNGVRAVQNLITVR